MADGLPKKDGQQHEDRHRHHHHHHHSRHRRLGIKAGRLTWWQILLTVVVVGSLAAYLARQFVVILEEWPEVEEYIE